MSTVYSPYRRREGGNLRVMFINPMDVRSLVETGFPHLGIGSLSAAIKRAFPGAETIVVKGHLQEWIHSWQPDVVAITSVSQYWDEARFHAQRAKQGNVPVMVGGVHATWLPDTMTDDMDVVALQEGEHTIVELLEIIREYGEFRPKALRRVDGVMFKDRGRVVRTEARAMVPDLDSLPHIDRSILPHSAHTGMFTSRGCPYRCLVGDTVVHTLDGDMPISSLVGRDDVMVLTRNENNYEPMYAHAKDIRMVEAGAEVVRVRFDDGSFIECTPDHEFMVFRYRNQYVPIEEERAVEAGCLQPGDQVRAMRLEKHPRSGRVSIATRRRVRRYRADLILEAMIGRGLEHGERCHHVDGVPSNDSPGNLQLTDVHKHTTLHPEVAERMRICNAAKDLTIERRRELGSMQRGKTRTLEQRLRYRESKLGPKNPHYNAARAHGRGRRSRVPGVVNHKVLSVEMLPERRDVYCMEVPGIHWFYANRVLVHNCTFCASTRYWPKVRFHSAAYVAEEIEELYRDGVRQVTFLDDLFVADKRRLVDIVERLGRRDMLGKLSYICNVRSNLVTEDLCRLLKDLGVKTVGIGMESANAESLAYLKGAGNITVDDHAMALQRLTDHGIVVHPSFIIGSPNETREQILETYRFIKGHRIPDFEVYVLMPFPGTPVWDYAVGRGLVGPDMKWERLRYTVTDFGPESIVLSEVLDYRELAELYKMFTDIRVRARQWAMLRQGVLHPWRAARFMARAMAGSLPEAYPPRRRQ